VRDGPACHVVRGCTPQHYRLRVFDQVGRRAMPFEVVCHDIIETLDGPGADAQDSCGGSGLNAG
jgi:hypothetical protein